MNKKEPRRTSQKMFWWVSFQKGPTKSVRVQ